jgi:hypothetical protein
VSGRKRAEDIGRVATLRDAPNLLLLALFVIAVPSCTAVAGPDDPISTSDAGSSASAVLTEGIAGTVKTASGEPVAGVFVQVAPSDSSAGPVPDIAIFTDDRGDFSWSLRPGRYRLTLILDGRTIGETEATVQTGRVNTITVQVDL